MTLQAPSLPGGSSSLAVVASHGHGYSVGCTSGGSDHGRGRGHDRSSRGGRIGRGSGSSTQPQCQVCWKIGHTTNNCWHRFDEDYVLEACTAASSSSGPDHNWYTDSGATDHITGDHDKLTMHDHYPVNDQIHAANGAGMNITRIGKTIIPTSHHDLVLDNVLHVSSTHKILTSVHRFTLDNDNFIEFHPYFFLIKDRKTRKVLLHRPCKGGLCPFHLHHLNIRSLFSVPSKFLLPVMAQSSWSSFFGHRSSGHVYE
jgi:hypothetical protein